MDSVIKIAGIGIVGASLALLIKKNSPEMSLMITIAVCVLIICVFLSFVSPILEFLKNLADTAGISSSLLSPLLKAIGIGIVSKSASQICIDAGESSIAAFIEMTGTMLAIYVSLPLMSSVLELVKSIM